MSSQRGWVFLAGEITDAQSIAAYALLLRERNA
jgi:hypothetical protein